MLDGRKWLKCGEIVVRDVNVDQVTELLNATDGVKSSVGDVEDDSQELKPTTGDFVAAAGFIVLGVVAMMVGISSILMNG